MKFWEPIMSNLAAGPVVPMPTLPFVMVIVSVPPATKPNLSAAVLYIPVSVSPVKARDSVPAPKVPEGRNTLP